MTECLNLKLDDRRVRFTPGGRISVLDAIRVVSDTDRPKALWQELQEAFPEVATFCQNDSAGESENPVHRTMPFADGEGWEKIFVLLFEYLSNRSEPE